MPPSPANGPPPTAEQQAVIDHQDGNLVVLAAVGSGKTTTLGRRIARALEQGIRPERVLALTFTNRAAMHMRESLERVVAPEIAQKVCLSTFHALCSRILRSANEAAGLPSDFRILDEDDAQELLADFDPDGAPGLRCSPWRRPRARPRSTAARWTTGTRACFWMLPGCPSTPKPSPTVARWTSPDSCT